MSSFVLFLSRFLQRPFQVASIMPSSAAMIQRVSSKMDLSKPVVVAEYGPGEGCHTREMLKRAHPESKFILFELDPEFQENLRKQFASDARVTVCGDAFTLPEELAKQDLTYCDYVVSGIPFSILEADKKKKLIQRTFDAIKPGGAFVIYQVTNELRKHCHKPELFTRADSEYFLQNVPPMFITVFHKDVKAEAVSQGRNGQRTGGSKARTQSVAPAA